VQGCNCLGGLVLATKKYSKTIADPITAGVSPGICGGETWNSGDCVILEGAEASAVSAVAVDYFEIIAYQSRTDGLRATGMDLSVKNAVDINRDFRAEGGLFILANEGKLLIRLNNAIEDHSAVFLFFLFDDDSFLSV